MPRLSPVALGTGGPCRRPAPRPDPPPGYPRVQLCANSSYTCLRRSPCTPRREPAMTDPDTFVFADDGAIPNSRLPLLVYRQAVPADAAAIERIFTANRWPAAWRS